MRGPLLRFPSLPASGLSSRWRPLAALRRSSPVLGGYQRSRFWGKYTPLLALLYIGVLILAALAVVYMGPGALMGMSIPLVALALLIIWALPDSKNPPLNWVNGLLFAFIVVLAIWPDYLAFDLPGLPWITAIRVIAVPLALAFLVSLSVSSVYRQSLSARLAVAPITHRLVLIFIGIAFFSLLVASNPVVSINKLVVAILYWFLPFYAAVWTFSRPNLALRLAYFLWFAVLVTVVIGLWEWRLKMIPWAGSVPSFLAIEDPVVQRILSGTARATTGIYRVQSKFTTPLGFAEFLAFSTPFVLYFAMYAKHWVFRVAAVATVPLILNAIFSTDSRLGFVGFVMSFLILLGLWSLRQWVRNRHSIFGPAITIAYPAILSVFLLATFFVGRLRNMVWGTGAQSYSSLAREEQVDMGLPIVFSQPWGHGIGNAASVLGYRNLEGTLTIDTYYLSVALEFGVIGFIIFFLIFLSALIYGVIYLVKAEEESDLLVMPIMATLSIFLVVKSVFSQQENHPLVFVLLGALFGICYRIKTRQLAETSG